jgi:hypothetical protein
LPIPEPQVSLFLISLDRAGIMEENTTLDL